MKLAVITCAYPSAAPFFSEFLEAMNRQSDSDFDLLIGNDGLDILKYNLLQRTKIRDFSGTPVAIRKQTISWAVKQGYDGLIFADADDTFHLNRVVLLRKKLEEGFSVVFHDLLLCSEKGVSLQSMLAGRFFNGQELGENDLKNCNFLGLSNTAVRTDQLLKVIEQVPDDVVAFDWAFYVRLLSMRKVRAMFIDEALSYYRIHGNNIASPQNLSDAQILSSVSVKKKHYSSVADLDVWYKNRASRFSKLEENLDKSKSFRDSYLEKVRLMIPSNPLWWEVARLPEEVGLKDSYS